MHAFTQGILSIAAPPSTARAEAPEPGAADRLRGVVHQRVVGLLNPMGAEHMASVGVRARLGDPANVLFTGTHAEAGVINYTSPIYSTTGGYLQVSPLAFLVLRAEITAMNMWPIGIEGAGYYPMDGYASDLGSANLAPDAGRDASGWNVLLSATLQGALPVGPVRLIVWDQLTFEHTSLGDDPFYFSPRLDLIAARQDWTVGNSAMVLVEADLGDGVGLRAGVFDDLRWVPGSDYLANQVGPILALAVTRADPAVAEVMPFVRGAIYTNGRRTEQLSLLAGVFVRYDLGAIP